MNKTRKITQGAMILAIIGALLAIDRQLSFLMDTIIVLGFAVAIIIYSSIYDVKDGLVISFGLIVLTVLFGSINTYLYAPISIILGISYSIGIKKDFSVRKLLITAIVSFTLGEILVCFIVGPLLGFDSIKQQVAFLGESMGSYFSAFEAIPGGESYANVIKTFFTENILLTILMVSTILVGIMEGIIIHLLTTFLLVRLKIKDLNKGNVLQIKPNPILAYVSIGCVCLMFFITRVSSEVLTMIFTILLSFGSIVLLYYGYLFCVIFSKINRPRKLGIFMFLAFILLLPFSIFILIIVGFLFASGPLFNVIDKGRDQ